MKLTSIIDTYRNQLIIQVVCVVWIIFLLAKIAIWGFEFGKWVAR